MTRKCYCRIINISRRALLPSAKGMKLFTRINSFTCESRIYLIFPISMGNVPPPIIIFLLFPQSQFFLANYYLESRQVVRIHRLHFKQAAYFNFNPYHFEFNINPEVIRIDLLLNTNETPSATTSPKPSILCIFLSQNTSR